VTPGEMLQRFWNSRQDLHGLFGDSLGKTANCFMQSGGERLYRKPLKGFHQSVREAVQSITVSHDAFPLYMVEDLSDFCRGAFAMIQEGDEVSNGTFKINIVLP
jgi:hypothetical protein